VHREVLNRIVSQGQSAGTGLIRPKPATHNERTRAAPATIMPLTHIDQILPRKFGYPMKIRIPTKLGFKNPKFVVELSVTNSYPGGFSEDYG
jgi:DMSO/TMAO reductase YedYZ molybdopterin-dependent catalytic subunit